MIYQCLSCGWAGNQPQWRWQAHYLPKRDPERPEHPRLSEQKRRAVCPRCLVSQVYPGGVRAMADLARENQAALKAFAPALKKR